VKRALLIAALAALAASPVAAQLSPISGSPLPSDRLRVPFPPGGPGASMLIGLPPSLGVRMRVPAHHGTEVYKLPVWSVLCPPHGGVRKLLRVNAVTSFERRGMVYVLESTFGPHEYPLACRLAPIRGRYTLVFYDPGQLRSPALLSRGPDYIVP
jgi:hypothetical protein